MSRPGPDCDHGTCPSVGLHSSTPALIQKHPRNIYLKEARRALSDFGSKQTESHSMDTLLLVATLAMLVDASPGLIFSCDVFCN